MTGPEHYREAERQLKLADLRADDARPEDAAFAQRQAQAHATLAVAAAIVDEPLVRAVVANVGLDDLGYEL